MLHTKVCANHLSQECDGDREVSASVPDSSVVCLGSMMPSALAVFWETAVVGDTGATVAIIGEHHVHLAENIRLLDVPVSVSTASGIIELTHAGDRYLPGCFGLMDGAFLNLKCKHSRCPVVKRCEDLGVGFTVSEGATSAGNSFFVTCGDQPRSLRRCCESSW